MNSGSSIFVFDLHVNCSVLGLNLNNLFVVDGEQNDLIVEIVNLNSFLVLSFSFYFDDIIFIEFDHFFLAFQSEIVFVL